VSQFYLSELTLLFAATRPGGTDGPRHFNTQIARAGFGNGGVPTEVSVVSAPSLPAVLVLQLCLPGVGQFVDDEVLEGAEEIFRLVLLQDECSVPEFDDVAVAENERTLVWPVVMAGVPVVRAELDRGEDDADVEGSSGTAKRAGAQRKITSAY